MIVNLAIDTSSGISSIAVGGDSRMLAEHISLEKGVQAGKLNIWIEECLKEAKLAYKDIDKILVCKGPGGFTGIRVGLAAARAISLSGNIKAEGFKTHEIMIASATDDIYAAIIPAGRDKYYVNIKDNPDIFLTNHFELLDLIANQKVISTCEIDNHESTIIHNPANNAHVMLKMAKRQLGGDTLPEYIRPPDAKKQKKLL